MNSTTDLHLAYLYDHWNLIREIDVSGSTQQSVRQYAWGLDLSQSLQGAGGVGGLLLVAGPDGVHAPTYDANGNISEYINISNGSTAAHFEYDAFGREIVSPVSAPAPFGFSTKYTDAETKLVYYGYRYYNPELGRWINRDPIGERGGLNLYGFVGNSMIGSIDYIGFNAIPTSTRGFTAHAGVTVEGIIGKKDHELNTQRTYVQYPNLAEAPAWDFTAGTDRAGATWTNFDLRFEFNQETCRLEISEAKHDGRYWFKNDFARRHEEVHVSDARIIWVQLFASALVLEGIRIDNHEAATCYSRVGESLRLAAIAVRQYIGTTRHLQVGGLAEYNDRLKPGERVAEEKELRRSRELISRARIEKLRCDQRYNAETETSISVLRSDWYKYDSDYNLLFTENWL